MLRFLSRTQKRKVTEDLPGLPWGQREQRAHLLLPRERALLASRQPETPRR